AMQEVWNDGHLRRRLSDEAVLGRCMFAPKNALRQASSQAATSEGVTPGTVVLMRLEAAHSRDPGHELAFLSQAWSHCPAASAVPTLFRAVWMKLKVDDAHV